MTHVSGTFHAPSIWPGALGAVLVAAGLIAGVALVGIPAPAATTPQAPDVAVPAARVADRAAILGQVQSEYLTGLARRWYPAVSPSLVQSEILLEISRGW